MTLCALCTGAGFVWRPDYAGDNVLLWYIAPDESQQSQGEREVPTNTAGAPITDKTHTQTEVCIDYILYGSYTNCILLHWHMKRFENF